VRSAAAARTSSPSPREKMPKSVSNKKKKKKNKRHDPLEKQILTSMEKGTLKEPKPYVP
jgi:hypothetical protein